MFFMIFHSNQLSFYKVSPLCSLLFNAKIEHVYEQQLFVHCYVLIGLDIANLNVCFIQLQTTIEVSSFFVLFSFVVTNPPLLLHVYKFKYLFSTKNNVVSCPPFILACHVTFSCCGALPSSLPLFSSCNYDPSNLDHIEVVVMSLNRSSYTHEESLLILSKVGIKKQDYDTTRKFQNKLFTKLSWAKCLQGKMEACTLSKVIFVLKQKGRINCLLLSGTFFVSMQVIKKLR